MAEIKKNERYIPLKNYFIALGLIAAVILITLYGFAWNRVRQENKVAVSYLAKNNIITKEIDSLEEIDSIIQEAPETFFIYVGYTGDEKIYELEKELASIIKDYKMNDSFYYLNVTKIKKNDDDYISKINDKLGLESVKIENVPTVLYFVDGKVPKSGIITTADGKLMTKNDFQKFLSINKIEKE